MSKEAEDLVRDIEQMAREEAAYWAALLEAKWWYDTLSDSDWRGTIIEAQRMQNRLDMSRNAFVTRADLLRSLRSQKTKGISLLLQPACHHIPLLLPPRHQPMNRQPRFIILRSQRQFLLFQRISLLFQRISLSSVSRPPPLGKSLGKPLRFQTKRLTLKNLKKAKIISLSERPSWGSLEKRFFKGSLWSYPNVYPS